MIDACVRRAFLCGDAYEHRRQWIEDKLLELAEHFCIDVAAYAIMSNHYHVVLFINHEAVMALSDIEVVQRWHGLFKGNMLSQKLEKGEQLSQSEWRVLSKTIDEWRIRLTSISWFMRVLNESIARLANEEDQCTGRFWEGRFKSQALLDEKALAACMAYVDLNPIRAKMAKTPESSDHTSIKQRAESASIASQPNRQRQQPENLLPFVGNPRKNMPQGIPFKLTDYLELVDLTGRLKRQDKRGSIDVSLSPILSRLGIQSDDWLRATNNFEVDFHRWVGSSMSIEVLTEEKGIRYIRQQSACRRVFG